MKHIAVVIVLPALTEAGAAARRCQEEKAAPMIEEWERWKETKNEQRYATMGNK